MTTVRTAVTVFHDCTSRKITRRLITRHSRDNLGACIMRVRVAHDTNVLTVVTEIGRRVLRPWLCMCAGREKKKERLTPCVPSSSSAEREYLAALLTPDVLMTASKIFRLLSQLNRIYTYCLILTLISWIIRIKCRINGLISNSTNQLSNAIRFWRCDFINFT